MHADSPEFQFVSSLFRCYECDEELSTHCNKKVLAQIVDFLQKHGARAEPSKFAQII